ncbi:hypothetical protein BDK51DRAFT_38012 [Blyttiomyces helicus]|uniref:Uncharacterized protein n=1 Tax=Blyttiomyces helicus TaxID=388810 RepID=A0A4P9WKB5_9FUNG|nr:hypothetical protein BDK51DRAFT_38012 [Blyttiomyces helicus]|eukprot:RKO91600.1 hypothetical protein BDK51DRAFT_38012 [Blyttiomyces helicus]
MRSSCPGILDGEAPLLSRGSPLDSFFIDREVCNGLSVQRTGCRNSPDASIPEESSPCEPSPLRRRVPKRRPPLPPNTLKTPTGATEKRALVRANDVDRNLRLPCKTVNKKGTRKKGRSQVLATPFRAVSGATVASCSHNPSNCDENPFPLFSPLLLQRPQAPTIPEAAASLRFGLYTSLHLPPPDITRHARGRRLEPPQRDMEVKETSSSTRRRRAIVAASRFSYSTARWSKENDNGLPARARSVWMGIGHDWFCITDPKSEHIAGTQGSRRVGIIADGVSPGMPTHASPPMNASSMVMASGLAAEESENEREWKGFGCRRPMNPEEFKKATNSDARSLLFTRATPRVNHINAVTPTSGTSTLLRFPIHSLFFASSTSTPKTMGGPATLQRWVSTRKPTVFKSVDTLVDASVLHTAKSVVIASPLDSRRSSLVTGKVPWLPYELLEAIVAYLVDDQTALHACTLACRRLHALATPLLYSCPRLDTEIAFRMFGRSVRAAAKMGQRKPVGSVVSRLMRQFRDDGGSEMAEKDPAPPLMTSTTLVRTLRFAHFDPFTGNPFPKTRVGTATTQTLISRTLGRWTARRTWTRVAALAAGRLPALSRLDLSGGGRWLADSVLRAIAAACAPRRDGTGIRELCLAGASRVTDVAVLDLVDALKGSLVSVDLSRCTGITDLTFGGVVLDLEDRLEEFDVSATGITSEAVLYVSAPPRP